MSSKYNISMQFTYLLLLVIFGIAVSQGNNNQPKQYCEYGENEFPFFPFRCPPFLANLTSAKRGGYFAIANNKQILIDQMKEDSLFWGLQNGIRGKVSIYFSLVEDFLLKLVVKLTQTEGITGEIIKVMNDIVRKGNQTQESKERDLAGLKRMEDYSTALNLFATEGTEEKFGEYIRQFQPSLWYATDAYSAKGNSNLNNIYGKTFNQQEQFRLNGQNNNDCCNGQGSTAAAPWNTQSNVNQNSNIPK